MYKRSTEIRHISGPHVDQLAKILDDMNGWMKLMGCIPKDLTVSPSRLSEAPKKYNSDKIRLIEKESFRSDRPGLEILFEEWGTSGRNRPTVGNLVDLLAAAELIRAAEYVADVFLNEPPPPRPTKGPAAKIVSPFDMEEDEEVSNMMEELSYPRSSDLGRNLNETSNMGNLDYYTKLDKGQKLQLESFDLMAFSTNSSNSTELPNLSALSGRETNDANIRNSPKANGDNETNGDQADKTEALNMPDLSALHMLSTTDTNELPDFSAFNLNVSNTATTSSNTSIGTVGDKEQDQHRLSVPNANGLYDDNNGSSDLSVLDQSSLDDSSLTNVTEASDELSLESQTRLNGSENDLPMLSMLQK